MMDGVRIDDSSTTMGYISGRSQGRQIAGSEYDSDNDSEAGGTKETEVCWVTELTSLGRFKSPYMACGNDYTVAYVYGCGCLIVKVGPYGKRKTSYTQG